MARTASTTAACFFVAACLSAQTAEPPIIQAVRSGNPVLIQKLAKDKAEVHKLGTQGQTALHEAAARCNVETILLLVDAGVDRFVVDSQNRTAATIAADCPPTTALMRATRALTPTKAVDEKFRWSLQDAANRGDIAVVSMLLQLGTDPNVIGSEGNRALEIAARKGNARLVDMLLERGADPNLKTSAGTTALHEAALGGSAQVIELLLAKGVDPNVPDKESNSTPLHYAASFNRVDAILALLKGKADPTRRDSKHRTPLDVARANNHTEAVAVLEKR